MRIKNIVKCLIQKHGTNDPFEIAAAKNIHVFEFNLHEDIYGYYKYIRGYQIICINSNLDRAKKIYTCCHELGHTQLHPRLDTPFLNKRTLVSADKIEMEANRFAIELLIPDEDIRQHEGMTINQIAALYGISADLVRLKKY